MAIESHRSQENTSPLDTAGNEPQPSEDGLDHRDSSDVSRRPPVGGGSLVAALRQEWSTGHLAIDGLPLDVRILAILGVGVILFACASLVLVALGAHTAIPSVGVVGRVVEFDRRGPVAVPWLLIPLASLGLGVAAASIGAAATRPGGSVARAAVAFVVLTNLAIGVMAFAIASDVQLASEVVRAETSVAGSLLIPVGVLGIGSAIGVGVLAVLRPRGANLLTPILAASPYVGLLVVIMLGVGQQGTLTPVQQALYPDFPPEFTVVGSVLGPLLSLLVLTSAVLFLISLWQTSTWSRASARLMGSRAAERAARSPWLLAVLLGGKLTWLALGLLGVLPAILGGGARAWQQIRSDDLGSWLYLGLLGAVVGWWVVTHRDRLHPVAAMRYAPVVAGAIAVWYALLGAVPMFAILADPVAFQTASTTDQSFASCFSTPGLDAPSMVQCLGLALSNWQAVAFFVLVAVSLVAGVLLLHRGERATGYFLAILGAWGLPRALVSVVSAPPAELPGLTSLPTFNAPQAETLDVAISAVVLVLAIMWWTGVQRRAGPGTLTVLLVISTVIVHAATLLPSATLTVFAILAVVFPVLYELCFESERLNALVATRSARVLAQLGLRAFALVLTATTVALGVSAVSSGTSEFAWILFGVPLAATITAVAVSERKALDAATGAATLRDPRHGVLRPLVPAGAGVAGVLALAVLGAGLSRAVDPLYPTPRQRLAQLERQIEEVDLLVFELARQPDATTGPRLQAASENAIRWLAANPAPDCAATAWARWRQELSDLRELGLLVTAALSGVPGAPEEIQALEQRGQTIDPQWRASNKKRHESVDVARAACA